MDKYKHIAILIIVVIVVIAYANRKPEYRSDFFEESSIKSHLSDRSRLSGCDPYDLGITNKKGDRTFPIWKVRDVEMAFRYDRDNDHVDIIYASFDSTVQTDEEIRDYGDELDISTVDEIDVEWWPLSDGTIYIDDIFFYGEKGIYGFHIWQEIPG